MDPRVLGQAPSGPAGNPKAAVPLSFTRNPGYLQPTYRSVPVQGSLFRIVDGTGTTSAQRVAFNWNAETDSTLNVAGGQGANSNAASDSNLDPNGAPWPFPAGWVGVVFVRVYAWDRESGGTGPMVNPWVDARWTLFKSGSIVPGFQHVFCNQASERITPTGTQRSKNPGVDFATAIPVLMRGGDSLEVELRNNANAAGDECTFLAQCWGWRFPEEDADSNWYSYLQK